MKKLNISNYEGLKDYQIQNWVIYNAQETDENYIFRLQRIDGNVIHSAVAFNREITNKGVMVHVMYESYSNKVWTGYIPLSDLKDKGKLWMLMESYIEEAHNKR